MKTREWRCGSGVPEIGSKALLDCLPPRTPGAPYRRLRAGRSGRGRLEPLVWSRCGQHAMLAWPGRRAGPGCRGPPCTCRRAGQDRLPAPQGGTSPTASLVHGFSVECCSVRLSSRARSTRPVAPSAGSPTAAVPGGCGFWSRRGPCAAAIPPPSRAGTRPVPACRMLPDQCHRLRGQPYGSAELAAPGQVLSPRRPVSWDIVTPRATGIPDIGPSGLPAGNPVDDQDEPLTIRTR